MSRLILHVPVKRSLVTGENYPVAETWFMLLSMTLYAQFERILHAGTTCLGSWAHKQEIEHPYHVTLFVLGYVNDLIY